MSMPPEWDSEEDEDEEQTGVSAIRRNAGRRETWVRLLFMIVLAVAYEVARVVAGVVVLFQFLWVLITGATNDHLLRLGQSLARYSYQILRYLTFNSEHRPFPFSEWPSGAQEGSGAASAEGGQS
jgi:hypothetical protein